MDKKSEEINSPEKRLKDRVTNATAWVFVSYAVSQIVRLGTNLILSRILFPEAFGLMGIVFTIQLGLSLLSDLGISTGIVIHKEGNQEKYLNTAWTFQIIRGIVLGSILFFGAGLFAAFLNNSQLEPLLRIVAIGTVISGFTSTKSALADRKINASRRVKVDIGTMLVNTSINIVLALWLRDTVALAWAIVIGNVVAVLASHWFLHGEPNKIDWEKTAVRGILSIGGMSFLSSALTYFVGEGSRLFSATMIDIKTFGLISLAGALSMAPWQAIQQISSRVFLPMYAEVSRDGDRHRLARIVRKVRRTQVLPAWGCYAILMVFSVPIFGILFDHRYSDGAFFLKVQSAGMMISILTMSYNGLLWGIGKLKVNFFLQLSQGIMTWLGMYFGFQWGGSTGLVIGTAASGALMFPITFLVYKKLGFSDVLLDFILVGATGCLIFLSFQVL